jgi:hypothetical protein
VTVLNRYEGMVYDTVWTEESSRRYGADHRYLSSYARCGRRL